MVRLRLKRMGRRRRPFYRISAFDQRAQRDGRSIEDLGWYDPLATEDQPQVKLDVERANYWLSVGAQPTRTVASLLKKQGVEAKAGAKAGQATS